MRQNDVPEVKERIDWQALNKLNLASMLFAGTDIPDLANYPKKPTKPF
jgi:hypothetical protein